MINLIPPHAQASVKHEYWIRTASIWLILIGTACAVVTFFSLPVYVLVHSQLEAFAQEYEQVSLESESYAVSEQAIVKANETAILLASSRSNHSFTTIIEELELLSANDVALSEYSISQKNGDLAPITIKGVAASRLALTSFQARIEAHPLFAEAVLPLANLARDRDIAFTITIQPQTEE